MRVLKNDLSDTAEHRFIWLLVHRHHAENDQYWWLYFVFSWLEIPIGLGEQGLMLTGNFCLWLWQLWFHCPTSLGTLSSWKRERQFLRCIWAHICKTWLALSLNAIDTVVIIVRTEINVGHFKTWVKCSVLLLKLYDNGQTAMCKLNESSTQIDLKHFNDTWDFPCIRCIVIWELERCSTGEVLSLKSSSLERPLGCLNDASRKVLLVNEHKSGRGAQWPRQRNWGCTRESAAVPNWQRAGPCTRNPCLYSMALNSQAAFGINCLLRQRGPCTRNPCLYSMA